jgi:CheY-like chemotaxis protein
MHQVLLNLCVNARDAMPQGGVLTLSAENVEIDASYASHIPGAQPGSYVMWRVTDTGVGIPADIIDRVFEPFFSTKGHGRGTGLGLSIVVGIAKSHHGFVSIYSTLGKGSTLSIYIPADLSGAAPSGVAPAAKPLFQGNGEAILVVDDSEGMRGAARIVLDSLNLLVLMATDGRDALALLEENEYKISAVVTDVHMPTMDGLAFVSELRKKLPYIGIIVISGNLDEEEANEFKKMGVRCFLEKPFTQDKLTAALATVIF